MPSLHAESSQNSIETNLRNIETSLHSNRQSKYLFREGPTSTVHVPGLHCSVDFGLWTLDFGRVYGRGVRRACLLQLHAPKQSPFCRDESRPDNGKSKVQRPKSKVRFTQTDFGHWTLELGQFVAVGVGIEPTFRAFQARANPSQLSDPGHCRFPISAGLWSLVFGFWSSVFGLWT